MGRSFKDRDRYENNKHSFRKGKNSHLKPKHGKNHRKYDLHDSDDISVDFDKFINKNYEF